MPAKRDISEVGEVEEHKAPRRGRRRKDEIQSSKKLMELTKEKQSEQPKGAAHGHLDQLDQEIESNVNSGLKDDIMEDMKQRIVEDLNTYLTRHGFVKDLVSVEDLLQEENRLEEEYRSRVSSNFYKLIDKSKDSQVMEKLVSGWTDHIPEVGKSYCADFFRPPHPFNPLERKCRRSEKGKCLASRLTAASRDESNSDFCLREFLLPEQKAKIQREMKNDLPPRDCLLCNRFITTYLVYQRMYYRNPVSYLIQDHKNTIGGTDGYDIQNCFPVMQPKTAFYGVAFPMVKFHYGDVIFMKQGDNLDIPLEQLKTIWSSFDMEPVTTDMCDNVLRSIPSLSHCRSYIVRGVAENSTPVFRIKNFPQFIECEMKPAQVQDF